MITGTSSKKFVPLSKLYESVVLHSAGLLLEKNIYYKIPEDKEQLLFDFYTLTLLQSLAVPGKIKDENLQYSLDEAVDILVPALREEMLKVTFFSLAAEFRHVTDKNSKEDIAKWAEENGWLDGWKRYMVEKQKMTGIISADLDDYLNDDEKPAARWKDDSREYRASFEGLKRNGMSKVENVEMMTAAYENLQWASSYGGPAWQKIGEAWLHLYNSVASSSKFKGEATKGNTIAWIDKVYDLQHNTDTVFNKTKKYYKDGGRGYSWIAKALDFKRYARSPWRFFDKVSDPVKSIIQYTARDLGYGSAEEFKQNLPKIMWDEYYDHVNTLKRMGKSTTSVAKPPFPDPSKVDIQNQAHTGIPDKNGWIKWDASLAKTAKDYPPGVDANTKVLWKTTTNSNPGGIPSNASNLTWDNSAISKITAYKIVSGGTQTANTPAAGTPDKDGWIPWVVTPGIYSGYPPNLKGSTKILVKFKNPDEDLKKAGMNPTPTYSWSWGDMGDSTIIAYKIADDKKTAQKVSTSFTSSPLYAPGKTHEEAAVEFVEWIEFHGGGYGNPPFNNYQLKEFYKKMTEDGCWPVTGSNIIAGMPNYLLLPFKCEYVITSKGEKIRPLSILPSLKWSKRYEVNVGVPVAAKVIGYCPIFTEAQIELKQSVQRDILNGEGND